MEEVEAEESGKGEAETELRSVPIEGKKEQKGRQKSHQPRKSRQERQKMSNQKVGGRDVEEKWQRQRSNRKGKRRPGGDKR